MGRGFKPGPGQHKSANQAVIGSCIPLEAAKVKQERRRRLSIRRWVAVAEWSKAPASFFCVRSRDSPEFEPSHGAHRQATLVVEAAPCTGRSTLTCSVWADSVLYMSIAD